ncbi:hypothetical protein V6N13_066857 [Hibiscus sabdariffa]|uniref:THAP-type domain-containing protein n=1 Tax=Hibiscus sabdariffa TaxID=183260 RepID=A0ABR2DT43_9ROSI
MDRSFVCKKHFSGMDSHEDEDDVQRPKTDVTSSKRQKHDLLTTTPRKAELGLFLDLVFRNSIPNGSISIVLSSRTCIF